MYEIERQIGENVRALRKERHLSQTALADVLGVTFQQLQKYERGENRLSAGRLYVLSRFFDVPYSLFFVGLENGRGTEMPDPALQRLCYKLSALPDEKGRNKITRALSVLAE